jgi:hypothetical protein
VNALGKILFLDCAFGIGMLALARFAPETKKALEEQAKETLQQAAPELAAQLEEASR